VVEHRHLGATIAGWWFGMLIVPGPSLMLLVSLRSQAMKMRGEVIVSQASVTCSPI
jgi:hypothetical protein